MNKLLIVTLFYGSFALASAPAATAATGTPAQAAQTGSATASQPQMKATAAEAGGPAGNVQGGAQAAALAAQAAPKVTKRVIAEFQVRNLDGVSDGVRKVTYIDQLRGQFIHKITQYGLEDKDKVDLILRSPKDMSAQDQVTMLINLLIQEERSTRAILAKFPDAERAYNYAHETITFTQNVDADAKSGDNK